MAKEAARRDFIIEKSRKNHTPSELKKFVEDVSVISEATNIEKAQGIQAPNTVRAVQGDPRKLEG